jgi:hypothetical protein
MDAEKWHCIIICPSGGHLLVILETHNRRGGGKIANSKSDKQKARLTPRDTKTEFRSFVRP